MIVSIVEISAFINTVIDISIYVWAEHDYEAEHDYDYHFRRERSEWRLGVYKGFLDFSLHTIFLFTIGLQGMIFLVQQGVQ